MPRSSTESPVVCQREAEEFIIKIDRLINYALNPEKAERFRRNFMLKNQYENIKVLKIRQKLEATLAKEKLNGYVAKVLASKTYLHDEGRRHIEKSVQLAGIVNNKVRRKVI